MTRRTWRQVVARIRRRARWSRRSYYAIVATDTGEVHRLLVR